MQVRFKKTLEIEGQKFGPNAHKKPVTFDNVPAFFLFNWLFVNYLKDGDAKILSVTRAEIEAIDKKYTQNKDGQKVKPDTFVVKLVNDLEFEAEKEEAIKKMDADRLAKKAQDPISGDEAPIEPVHPETSDVDPINMGDEEVLTSDETPDEEPPMAPMEVAEEKNEVVEQTSSRSNGRNSRRGGGR